MQQPSSGAAPFMVDPKTVATVVGSHDPTKHTTCVVLMCWMAPALTVHLFYGSFCQSLKGVLAHCDGRSLVDMMPVTAFRLLALQGSH